MLAAFQFLKENSLSRYTKSRRDISIVRQIAKRLNMHCWLANAVRKSILIDRSIHSYNKIEIVFPWSATFIPESSMEPQYYGTPSEAPTEN